MKDMQAQLEKLRTDAAECALIRDLATEWHSACNIGSDAYVERPGLQDLSLVEQGMTVRSYVRPLNAAPGRWPR